MDKSTKGSGATTLTNKYLSQNQQLAEELHKPIIRKFKKRKVHSTFNRCIQHIMKENLLLLKDSLER